MGLGEEEFRRGVGVEEFEQGAGAGEESEEEERTLKGEEVRRVLFEGKRMEEGGLGAFCGSLSLSMEVLWLLAG